jgi:hypothetical protein
MVADCWLFIERIIWLAVAWPRTATAIVALLVFPTPFLTVAGGRCPESAP